MHSPSLLKPTGMKLTAHLHIPIQRHQLNTAGNDDEAVKLTLSNSSRNPGCSDAGNEAMSADKERSAVWSAGDVPGVDIVNI